MCSGNDCLAAVHGNRQVFSCLNCGQGWQMGIKGSKSYKEIIVDFKRVTKKIFVMAGKRKVRLEAIPIEEEKRLGARWLGSGDF
jgi:hypothetical protein